MSFFENIVYIVKRPLFLPIFSRNYHNRSIRSQDIELLHKSDFVGANEPPAILWKIHVGADGIGEERKRVSDNDYRFNTIPRRGGGGVGAQFSHIFRIFRAKYFIFAVAKLHELMKYLANLYYKFKRARLNDAILNMSYFPPKATAVVPT